MRQRGWRWLPAAHRVGTVVAAVLVVGVVGWNVQAFLRGVGPGRLPDLRARDATTAAQIEFVRQQPSASTLVLAHDIVRQLAYARVAVNVGLLYSEYVPDFERARTRTDLSPATEQVVVLDSPLQVPSDDAARVHEVVLREQPRVSVWVIDTRNARAIEHGYRFADVLGE